MYRRSQRNDSISAPPNEIMGAHPEEKRDAEVAFIMPLAQFNLHLYCQCVLYIILPKMQGVSQQLALGNVQEK